MPPIVDSGRHFLGDESLSGSNPRADRERREGAARKAGHLSPGAGDSLPAGVSGRWLCPVSVGPGVCQSATRLRTNC